MAIERRRRCGFRKVGGLYLVSDGPGAVCGRLPVPLTCCPTCSAGIKQARGWTWVEAPALFAGSICKEKVLSACVHCPLGIPSRIGRAGLLWVGGVFYPTVESFNGEARELGISRRIARLPRGFKAGETWVLLAHPQGADCPDCMGRGLVVKGAGTEAQDCGECAGPNGSTGKRPAIFTVFQPARVERIITESQAQDDDVMQSLERQGITPVVVPDDDPDHQGTVWDEELQPELAYSDVGVAVAGGGL